MPSPKLTPPIALASADGTMATVKIGASKTKYVVHKALLVHHSEYFAKALNGPWVEAQTNSVSLEDVGKEEFNLFVHWLYAQQIPKDYYVLAHTMVGEYGSLFENLVSAYVLGDRLLAPVFRREINNVFVTQYPEAPGCCGPSRMLRALTLAFKNVPANRSFLQFLVNSFCESWDPLEEADLDYHVKLDQDALLKLPPAFNARVLQRFAYVHQHKDKCQAEECYLEHATDQEKELCKKTHMDFNPCGKLGYGFYGEPRDRY